MRIELGHKFWIFATVVILILVGYVVGRNALHAMKIKADIRRLMRQKEQYMEQIARDSTIIEQLRYDDGLEEYARENFRMRRRGDKVYIME